MNKCEINPSLTGNYCSQLHMMRSVDPSILSNDVKFIRKIEKGMFITEE
jgi:hypothetical protein